jgi:hypothetical protein
MSLTQTTTLGGQDLQSLHRINIQDKIGTFLCENTVFDRVVACLPIAMADCLSDATFPT